MRSAPRAGSRWVVVNLSSHPKLIDSGRPVMFHQINDDSMKVAARVLVLSPVETRPPAGQNLLVAERDARPWTCPKGVGRISHFLHPGLIPSALTETQKLSRCDPESCCTLCPL